MPPDDASLWPAVSGDGRARRIALGGLAEPPMTSASVSYRSAGAVLIIGSEDSVTHAREKLEDALRCTLLITDTLLMADPLPITEVADNTGAGPGGHPQAFRAPLVRLNGHLGQFLVEVEHQGSTHNLAALVDPARSYFDLVLDLGRRPWIRRDIPPPGYYAPGNDAGAFESAVAELRDLVGEFEKPRYFAYNADICAHGRSGLSGCTRCLDACPTEAIASLGERIEVDPYLCQGGGSCATACPSGAISYTHPPAADLLQSVKTLLEDYRVAGGSHPVVVFVDRDQGRTALEVSAETLPEQVLPVPVEEIGSIGLDTWLAALAYGADQVWLLAHPAVPPSVRHELDRQLDVAGALLDGLNASRDRIRVWSGDPAALPMGGAADAAAEPAGFAPAGGKRAVLRFAIDHLYRQSGAGAASTALPSHAPFGAISVDREACTLCMACVSVCPAAALEAGGDSPRLGFIEWNCVQCGLCETGCPENAITRQARFVFDTDERMRTRVLNEEPPFHCVRCGKPFATRSVMERMRAKLENHPMFQQPGALQRLQMCEDCRVKDMFIGEGGLDQG